MFVRKNVPWGSPSRPSYPRPLTSRLVSAQNFHTPGYAETGAIPNGFALTFNGRDASDTRSEVGARFDRVLAVYSNAVLALRTRVAWAREWVSDAALTPLFPGTSGHELRCQRRAAGAQLGAG